MHQLIALFVFVASTVGSPAGEFAPGSSFPKLADLISALSAYTPATSANELRSVFSVPEPGEIAPGDTRPTRVATAIVSCDQIWADDHFALIFVTARPPTDATPSEIGTLFLAAQQKDGWRIVDTQRFLALGKYAKVSAELTAGTGRGYSLGAEGFHPIITIKEFQGGRGYSYDLSASYTIKDQKISRHDLHQ